ncbi:(R)-mandelonitrile lyase 1 [Cannabis sativa]|uniref:(R)-mandelonitrile lyase 1 n=1 Tax=Cannabis sativa TaxID=3483 RepID=UPI0029CA29C6|nr:(R)-mandelonitrile lyase 1 [Cannabis sativa]
MAPISLLVVLLMSCSFNHHQLQLVLANNPFDQDFSYMKSVHNINGEEEIGSSNYNNNYYDYIIIGGGTAGCPLAATLSENYSVLVLERGNAPQSHPTVFTLAGFFSDLQKQDDGTTPFQSFTSKDGVGNRRGRVLGGSSMINGGFYSRADDEFFAKSGVEWEMDLVEKAYEWVEESVVSTHPRLDVWQSSMREALLEAGVGPDNGFSLNHKVGTKTSGSLFDQFGTRHGAVQLLNRANLDNLRVVVQATVDRIIFDSTTTKPYSSSKPSAIGVKYSDSKGKSHKAFLRRKGEIILSAGAIGSPQLLLLSGIGPQSQHPNVGKFMADNPMNIINILLPNSSMEPSITKVVGINDNYFIEPVIFQPQLNMTSGSLAEKIPGPLSIGSLWLANSTDVKVTPNVRFNYFDNPIDLSRCVMGMRKIGEMLETEAMNQFKHNGELLFSGPSLPNNNSNNWEWESFCRTTVGTFYHYHGGCVVGKVVDGDFNVMGIKSVRVVDGSTFNISPGTNPQATLMMLGRYIGLKMLGERSRE